MRKIVSGIIIVLSAFFVFAGCSDMPTNGTPTIVHEDESVELIRSMMELDYASMTVAEFNEAIQTLCEDADTTVFEVISDAYDHFAVYNESGEFMYHLFSDHSLEAFMQTALSYSAQEIFEKPVHMGSIMYMTMPNMTAMEVSQKREQMRSDEWERYFEENIADISVFPALFYVIEANIQDPGAITVYARDSKINGIHSAIKEFLLGLDKEAAMAETLEGDILAEFDRLSAKYSDNKVIVECRVQSIEHDIANETRVPPSYLPLLSNEADLKLREDFAEYKSDIWRDITSDEVFVRGYYGTYDGCEAVVMYGIDMPMTDDIQEIEVAGCTIWLQSGSLELLLHKDSGFIDIKDAYAQGYLSEDDVFSIAAYVNLKS